MKISRLLLPLALLLALGCTDVRSATTPASSVPATAPVPSSIANTSGPAIATVAVFSDVNPDPLLPNETMTVELTLEPVLFETGVTADGTKYSSRRPDPNSPVREMRACFQFDAACAPSGSWLPFQTKLAQSFPVDWIGTRELYYLVEFRDQSAVAVPAIDQIETPERLPGAMLLLHSVWDTRTPLAAQPPFVQTAISATRVAFPVTGSLILEDGRSMAGGQVNSTINITAAFSATSPHGEVTEMRLLHLCPVAQEIETAPWEPFVSQKTFPYTISTPNFVGWYLAVQFRDEQGNLSPVYCSDISVEGMP